MQACLKLSSLPFRDDCLAAFAPSLPFAAFVAGVILCAIVAKLAADYFLN